MVWNEQDHPRDDDGKFTFKNGGVTNKTNKEILFEKSNKQKELQTTKQKRKNELLDILKDKATPADILYADNEKLEKKIKEYGLKEKMTTNVNKTLWDNPVNNPKISSPYGWRTHPIQNTKKHHNGVDIAIPQGTSVKAQAEGVVEYAGLAGGYGNLIIINHGKINGKEIKTKYAHLSKINIKKGDKVGKNTEIAKSGGKKGTAGAGSSTGAHLHLEVLEEGKHVNPQKYFKF